MLQADSCTKTSKQEGNEATGGGKLYRERMLQADSCTKISNQEGNEATGGGKLYRNSRKQLKFLYRFERRNILSNE